LPKASKSTKTPKTKATVRNGKGFIIAVTAFVVLATAAAILWLWYITPVISETSIKIGVTGTFPPPETWFSRLRGDAVFENLPDNNVPGEHFVTIRVGGRLYELPVYIEDNIAPTATPVNITAVLNSELSPSDFYTDLFDHSETTSRFVQEPNTSTPGRHDVAVSITDVYGNERIIDTWCEVFVVTNEIVMERGVYRSFDIDDFVTNTTAARRIEWLPPSGFYRRVGEYEVVVMVDGVRHYSKIVVVDTTPPTAEPRSVRIFIGERTDVDEFYRVITEDDSDEYDEQVEEVITATFAEEPDWDYAGTQTVTVRVSDECGNYVDVESELTILVDTTPPQIHGARDIRVLVGTTISFRSGITVTDDLDPNPSLSVDSSAVNINRIGVYPVTYTARDRAGNTSSVTINVRVTDVTIEDLHDLADRRLQSIGVFRTESLPERARLIHNYVRSNMTYVRSIGPAGHSDEYFAYRTLRNMRGNCIASQRASEILLTRAGVENMRIRNIADTHSWNLIRIDGVWYHYDATAFPRCRYTNSHMFNHETALRISPNRNSRYDAIDWTIYPEVGVAVPDELPQTPQEPETTENTEEQHSQDGLES
jgi:hypothetical protein